MRGAGPGAQAARGSPEPSGSQAAGKPRGSPRVHLLAADSRWAQRGMAGRAEPGPQPCSARTRSGAGRRAGSEAVQSARLRGLGAARSGRAFPAVVISAGARVGARALALPRSFLPRDARCELLFLPSLGGTLPWRRLRPQCGNPELTLCSLAFACRGGRDVPRPLVECEDVVPGWDRRAPEVTNRPGLCRRAWKLVQRVNCQPRSSGNSGTGRLRLAGKTNERKNV